MGFVEFVVRFVVVALSIGVVAMLMSMFIFGE